MAGKRINLVLSGGGVRGLAHIGVIRVLLDEGFVINRIAGCSIGSIVGSLFAATKDIDFVERVFLSHSSLSFFDPSFSRLGLIKGDRFEAILRKSLPVKRFDDLLIPLVVNATDAVSGEEVVFSDGLIVPAVRASSSIPGFFSPKRFKGRLLLDGGLVNPVPLSLLSDRLPVVVSDVSVNKKFYRKGGLSDILRHSIGILQHSLIEEKLSHSSHSFIRILPDVHEWDIISLKYDPEIINRGVVAARSSLPRINRLVSSFNKRKRK